MKWGPGGHIWPNCDHNSTKSDVFQWIFNLIPLQCIQVLSCFASELQI